MRFHSSLILNDLEIVFLNLNRTRQKKTRLPVKDIMIRDLLRLLARHLLVEFFKNLSSLTSGNFHTIIKRRFQIKILLQLILKPWLFLLEFEINVSIANKELIDFVRNNEKTNQ